MAKILLVYDDINWCFGHHSKAIQKYAQDDFEVLTCSQSDLSHYATSTKWLRSFDAIHHWSWAELPLLFGMNRLTTCVAHHGCQFEYETDEDGNPTMDYWPQLASTSRQRNITEAKRVFPRPDGIIAVNEELSQFAKSLDSAPVTYLPVGVDTEVFYQANPIRTDGNLRVGWCGQLNAGPGQENTKGYNWVLTPLKERLRGAPVEIVENTRSAANPMSQDEMREWYNSIDVFLCTSISEGTPAPPMEAMVCGRPVISPRVGDLGNMVTESSGFLGEPYTDAESADRLTQWLDIRIRDMCRDREIAVRMGREAMKVMRGKFSWSELSGMWLQAIRPLILGEEA